jgi:bla regulator protein blaR1
MNWLIPLAVKSFLVAGGALLLLKLMQKRSAADRSWIAHLALAALLLLPLASVALPALDVVGPEILVGKAEVDSPSLVLPSGSAETSPPAAAAKPAEVPVVSQQETGDARVDWPFWGYAAPAALLLLLTMIALARLVVLKSRATVLVDAPWLTALARAQKRMGFKHGTALLTSNELPSPISWGVIRPVILLNSEAAESHDEAEAIITHELAHVARLDWAKLLLSRVAVALFWFNPFVWLLAREAHQLREEAADDAVLATDIDGAEYASLLVGVARHECRGMLIGAHGVAPGRNSLTRRVKRVLDGAVKRAPGGWRWGSAAAFFAAGMAVPVAALNLVPAASAAADAKSVEDSHYSSPVEAAAAQSMSSAKQAMAGGATAVSAAKEFAVASGARSVITSSDGLTVLRSADGNTITISPPDEKGRRRTVLRNSSGGVIEYADADAVPGLPAAFANTRAPKSAVDRAIELKAVGATPDYIDGIQSAAPQLHLDHDDIVQLKAVGVTPAFLQELARLGYRNLSADEITGAYAVGVREDYVRSLAAAGYGRISLDQLTELKAVGVTAADIERFRRAGYSHLDPDKLIQMKNLGITPEELRASQRYGP